MQTITSIIREGRVISINVKLATAVGLNEAAFICNLVYWEGKQYDKEGWIYKTIGELTNETTLSRFQQREVRTVLRKAGVLLEKKGQHSLLYFKLDHDKLDEYFLLKESSVHKVISTQSVQMTYNKCTDETQKPASDAREHDSNNNTIASNTHLLSPSSDESASSKPFVWPEYLEEMSKHKSRHIRLIALFWKAKDITFDTREAAGAAMKRHLKDAAVLSKFSPELLKLAVQYRKAKYPNIDWTLGTLYKIITSVSANELREYA